MPDDGNAEIANARVGHLGEFSVIDDDAVDPHESRRLKIVSRVADIEDLRRVAAYLPEMRGTAGDFVAFEIVGAAETRKIRIEIVFRDNGSETVVGIGGKNRLSDSHFADPVDKVARAVVEVAVVPAFFVGVHKVGADLLEMLRVADGKTESAVGVDEREIKDFAVTLRRAVRELELLELFVETIDAEQKVVEQRSVPIPNDVFVVF